MTPDLSRRIGAALGWHAVAPADRAMVISAVEAGADTFAELPEDVQRIIEALEATPPFVTASSGPTLWSGCRFCLNPRHPGPCTKKSSIPKLGGDGAGADSG